MFGRRQWLLVLALIGALLVTGMFTIRAVRHARNFRQRADEPIQSWMSVPYIAHSYHVPPDVLYQALGLPPGPPDRRPIRDIATQQNRSVDEIKAALMQAIIRARPPYPPPPKPERAP